MQCGSSSLSRHTSKYLVRMWKAACTDPQLQDLIRAKHIVGSMLIVCFMGITG